ncbi:DUF221-domain-containing protein [Suhomyces tanzawaensis NRRL Y-17324]|uniref:DUF221-domain-containing protein n=1 Tax=Suhomyces tanzawaensis NRRL Y-17324 TaxID=984487 RepID=A0A1E4SGI4_9ASCO|nr:DUF221-domain-containing protein [Suhomyces tanzawaensis NRRL Y-17324]ODV78580.1 DUF221-domain-containing protein [Suhomyces tanzawaensis NRRL Y-17324]
MNSLTELLFASNVTATARKDHHDVYRPATGRIARYQVIVSLVLGLSAFLTFSFLRVRYPKIYVANFNSFNSNYLHSTSRRKLPKIPAKSLFGWIPIVYGISEEQILEHAGLDAVVFLGFFKMCIKIITTCLFLAITILSPVRYYFTGRLDQDYPSDSEDEGDNMAKRMWWGVLDSENAEGSYQHFLWLYTAFTYVFTFIVCYFLFKQTVKIINMRQAYLGSQNSITDRTIKLSGIPPVLRDEEDLKRHIESLGIGEVDSIVIVKEWTSLNNLFNLRKKILRNLEVQWVEYFKRSGIANKNDLLSANIHPNLGDTINLDERYSDSPQESPLQSPPQSNTPRSSIIEQITEIIEQADQGLDDSTNNLPLLNDELNCRPQINKGFLGWFGPKVDAINYYTEQLEIIDKEILRARSKEYPATSTSFITMKTVAQAQMVAQAVLDPKINHLITNLAPAPHDIRWENLCLSRSERNTRIFFTTVFIGILSILLVFPVSYLANFLNVKSISRVWPKLGELLKANKWAETLITGLLPTYIFTILNLIMPYFYIWISKRQGFTSHSDEELSTVSKNFFYIFVNLFLIFTVFGTASLSDTSKIANQLAQSLRDLSLFYVDLIILQGLGIFPYKLLLLGNLIKFPLGSIFWCKTPRDHLKLYKPPVFNFGLQLPQPILIFIITIVYSVMSSKILTAGLIYFIIGFFVCKYQLLYACVHPPHSTGKVWPLVFRRIILGLLLFQLTMVGTLALQKAYICASFLAPLPLLTLSLLWNFQKNYIPLSIFIALRSIENDQTFRNDDQENVWQLNDRTLDERRELNKTYEFPHLLDDLDGPLIAIDGNDVLMINKEGLSIKSTQDFEQWD